MSVTAFTTCIDYPKKPFDKNNPIIGKATWEIITARKTPCIYSAAPAPEIFSSENYS